MKRTVLFLCCLLLWPGLCLGQVYFEKPPEDWKEEEILRWTVFDVNEGDAMLLECGGESMMVDGGPKPFRDPLRDALLARNLKHMKYMLSTHYHDDHIDGLYYLLTYGFTAEEFLHPYTKKDMEKDKRARRTVAEAEKAGIPTRRVGDGDSLTLGKAKIDLYRCLSLRGENQQSLVLKVSFRNSSLLLCADISGSVQRFFLDVLPPAVLKADLIKLPHHAINTTVPEFLDAVSPLAAVATNREKHVDGRSLAQLDSRKLPTLFSGDATVYAVTNGEDWYLYQTPGEL